MKLVIDFEKLEYLKPKTSFDVLVNFFLDPLKDVVGATPDNPPFDYKYTGISRFLPKLKAVSYKDLGTIISFDDEEANQVLKKHLPRLSVYLFLSSVLYNLFIALFVVTAFVIIIFTRPANASMVFDIFSSALLLILSAIYFLFALKISVILIDRHFADSLALISGIYLLIILEKESNLSDPEARRDILERIRILRRNITLLSLTFFPDDDARSAVHFKQLENFVRERERWAITPQTQTLDDLRRDFGQFVEMLVTGQYGDFTWDASKISPIIAPVERKPAEKVIRFLAGGLPFVLLMILFLFPAQISAIGFDHNVVTLFLLAWLLLAIDSGLNLGLVERAGGLAKTFKDLR